jgi:hypothetical protein
MTKKKGRKAAKTTAVVSTAANQVTSKKLSRKKDAPAPVTTADARNPFKPESIAGRVTAKLLTGQSFGLVSLFAGIESKLPNAIMSDLKQKGLPVMFDRQTKTYSLGK